jgi:hypothetical protein
MLSPVHHDKNFGNLISLWNFLFGETSPLIDPRTSTQAGGSFFYAVKGGKKELAGSNGEIGQPRIFVYSWQLS